MDGQMRRDWELLRVHISGDSMSGEQVAGQHATFVLHFHNRGRSIPHLLLWFQGLGVG